MTQVLYHANCYDGFGAAFAAWKALGNTAEYTPMGYGDPLPEFEPGSKVYLLDYSRKREELEKLVSSGVEVQVIDHHKTAQEALDGLPYAIFDMEKSGAVLSWEFFNPDKRVPIVLKHIQDRDLWRFQMEHTKQIHAALCATEFDFQVWDEIIGGIEHWDDCIYAENFRNLVVKGQAILDYHNVLTGTLCNEVNMMTIGGYQVPVANVSLLFSEVPHKLLSLYPDAMFAAYRYYKADGVVQYGLRGRGDFDVSAIAKQYGGGGHHNAAGFEVKEQADAPPSKGAGMHDGGGV